MRTPTRLIVSALTVVALSASSAGAVATLVSPSGGASMTTTHPAFAWSLPAGERGLSISVARAPTINPSTSDFMLAELADAAVLEAGASKYMPSRPLPAGTYYWHVATSSANRPREFSAVSSFVIRPVISKPSIEIKKYLGQRMFLITTSWIANVRLVGLTAQLFAGSKRIAERKLMTDNVLIDAKKVDLSTWMIPATVKKGARLRFVVKLAAERGAKASSTKTLRAP